MTAALRSLPPNPCRLYIAIVVPRSYRIALLFGKVRLLYRVADLGIRSRWQSAGFGCTSAAPSTFITTAQRSTPSTTQQCRAADSLFMPARLFPRLRILYKAELRKLPVLVHAFDLAQFVPRCEATGIRACPPSIARRPRCATGIRSSFSPKARGADGSLGPSKGGFIMALAAQAICRTGGHHGAR